jgi:protein-S-isoprenylcysteine O-methyltransferase Ste14
MYRALITVAWLFGIAYSQVPGFWLLVHPFAERWRTRRRSAYPVVVPLWLAEMALIAAITWRWREVVLYQSRLLWIPAAALLLAGAWLYRTGHRGFTHEQLIGRAEIERSREQRLVTSGIRSRIRHPFYLAHLLELIAWTVGSGLLVLYLLLAWALATYPLMVRVEDAELERRFGDAYRDYRRRVPALLPGRR